MPTIFVFGSNEAGRHGKGAALAALKFGAKYGQGFGQAGESFAIPTKDKNLNTLPLDFIQMYVNVFLAYARVTPGTNYQVTRIGCGLAGLRNEDVAPLFKLAPTNCWFDTEWEPWLGNTVTYWGSHQ